MKSAWVKKSCQAQLTRKNSSQSNLLNKKAIKTLKNRKKLRNKEKSKRMKRKIFDRITQENHRKLSTSGNNYSNKMSKINRWFKKLSHQ